jgi:uncharacterized protein YkwD
MKKIFTIIFILIFPILTTAANLGSSLSGKILLQVEENGEAWYVNPADEQRYYMGRPLDAFNLMRELGVGISNNDLKKIPIAESNFEGEDYDEDGLSNMIEDSIGTDKFNFDSDFDGYNDKEELINSKNPLGSGLLNYDLNFANKHKGKIFLQIEAHGEAWYINPDNSKRYFLGRPLDAFNIMRSLGLGITNTNLETILLSSKDVSDDKNDEISAFDDLEKKIHNLINRERATEGLSALNWNSEVAKTARKHSQNLAKENVTLTRTNTLCNYPLIHHEGITDGIYQKDRLENNDIYYFGMSGENIALIPKTKEQAYVYSSEEDDPSHDCRNTEIENIFRTQLDGEEDESKKIERILQEIKYREGLMALEQEINFTETIYNTDTEIALDAVQGWMNSPGHKKNILTADFDEAGIGVAKEKNYLIITQVFIKRAACGYESGPCCVKEGYYPSCYVPLTCSTDNTCIE